MILCGGGRILSDIKESITLISLYNDLNTIKIDTTNMSLDDVVNQILKL